MSKHRKINEVSVYISRGISPKYDEVGYRVINQKCIRGNVLSLVPIRYSSKEKTRLSPEKTVKKFDVLVNSTGVGTLGRVAQVKSELIDTTVDSHVTIVRPDLEIVDGYYFGYAMVYRESRIESLGIGATGQTELSRNDLGEIDIPIYSMPIQHRIGKILSLYDELIKNNSRRIDILEDIAKTIYREWFIEFRFPDHEGIPRVDSAMGPIPEGWQVIPIADAINTIEAGNRPRGGINPDESDVPSIGATNIIGLGKYDYSKDRFVSQDYFDSMKKGIVKHEDVLLYKDGAQIGRKSLFRDGFPHEICCINSHVFILRSNDLCSQSYLYFYLDTPDMTQAIINLNTNAAQPGINQPKVKSLPIIIPTREHIEMFENTIEPIMGLLFNLAKKNELLKQTRDILLPQLITGDLDVGEIVI